jgi:5-methylcytosine-specific restriction endonuclease McrA
MDLPNFYKYAALNRLKEQMGIPRDTYGSLVVMIAPAGLTREELDKLASGAGIDVTWDQITTDDDGTFVLKGERVVLYIRDFDDYGRGGDGPRYHLMTCRTIVQMRDAGRMQRYVVASEPNGLFVVNVKSNLGTRQEHRRLRVCWNCLTELNFGGFRTGQHFNKKRVVQEFTPARFFAEYSRSLHLYLPTHGEADARLNAYSADFPEISRAVRERTGWQCDDCKRVLADPSLQKYLHVHHRDGDRSNNTASNLRALCVGCHAEQPSHQHMKGTPDYREYMWARPMRP